MKVYKVELMVLDFDNIGVAGIKDELENIQYADHCISSTVKGCESRDIGEWNDGHPLNHQETEDPEYRRLFGLTASDNRTDAT